MNEKDAKVFLELIEDALEKTGKSDAILPDFEDKFKMLKSRVSNAIKNEAITPEMALEFGEEVTHLFHNASQAAKQEDRRLIKNPMAIVRLQVFMMKTGFKQQALSDSLKQGSSTVNNYLRFKSDIPWTTAYALAYKHHVNPEWLMEGRGDSSRDELGKIEVTIEEQRVLKIERLLKEDDKRILQNLREHFWGKRRVKQGFVEMDE